MPAPTPTTLAPSAPIRIAHPNPTTLCLDLANPGHQYIEITPAGWSLRTPSRAGEALNTAGSDPSRRQIASLQIENGQSEIPSIQFSRPPGMLLLPTPRSGSGEPPYAASTCAPAPAAIQQIPNSKFTIPNSSISLLRPLLNLPGDRAWTLLVAWLLGALHPGHPCPILALTGEQGTAKTTLARLIRALIDPHDVPLRAPPRNQRHLADAAASGWVCAFDNLSSIPAPLADALARLVTGGGFATGQRDAAGRATVFQARRPVIINGIDDLATRGDLVDRCLILRLPPIPARRRLAEAQVWDQFEAVRPRVLGALLDAVATGLANFPTLALDEKPRMADFALWVAAAEPSLPWAPGAFLEAYNLNRDLASRTAVLSTPLVCAILDFMDTSDRRQWQGTAADLFRFLMNWYSARHRRTLSAAGVNPSKLGTLLRRLAPNLRAMGVDVTFGRHTNQGNIIILTPLEPSPDMDFADSQASSSP